MPTRALSDIEVAQRAMRLAGMTPIDSWDDPGDACETLKGVYEDLVQAEIALHNWKFATGDVVLARLAATPLYGFNAAYQMPGDPPCLNIRSVHVGDQPQRWRVAQDKIYLDANDTDEVILTGQFRSPTNLWPPYFTLYFETRLAAWVSASITRNGSLAEVWTSAADNHLIRARGRDAQQQTAERFPIGRFTAVRRGARQ